MKYLVQSQLHWLEIDGVDFSEIEPFPAVSEDVVFFPDFKDANSGILLINQNKNYADAFIQKHLRDTGILVGEVKVFIHDFIKMGKEGIRAFYTATPLKQWHEIVEWQKGQDHQCIIVNPLRILWKSLKINQCFVYRKELNFIFAAKLKREWIYLETTAFSHDENDLILAATALSNQIKSAKIDSEVVGAWHELIFSKDDTAKLIKVVEDNTGISFSNGGGEGIIINSSEKNENHPELSVLSLLARPRDFLGVFPENPLLEGVAWGAKALKEKLMIAMLLFSVIFVLMFIRQTYQIIEMQEGVEKSNADLNRLNNKIHENSAMTELPEEVAGNLKFLRDFSEAYKKYDVWSIVKTVKEATSDDIKILRIYSGDKFQEGEKNKSGKNFGQKNKDRAEEKNSSFYIDGSFYEDSKKSNDQVLADFLYNLQQRGLKVVPVEIPETDKSVSSVGFFTYKVILPDE